MGNKRKTVQNLKVMRIDEARNLVFVRGAVPGNAGRPVKLRAAVKKVTANARDPVMLENEVKDVGLKDIAAINDAVRDVAQAQDLAA